MSWQPGNQIIPAPFQSGNFMLQLKYTFVRIAHWRYLSFPWLRLYNHANDNIYAGKGEAREDSLDRIKFCCPALWHFAGKPGRSAAVKRGIIFAYPDFPRR